MPAKVNLEHHLFETDFSKLIKNNTRDYYNDNEAWEELNELDAIKPNLQNKLANIVLDDNDLHVGNHAFTEAVFSNPVSDLKEYKQWKDGVRQFPFSGQYFKLAITEQKQKKASEAMKGALGEIIGGTFFNTNAHILVRPIQRYPDFIGKQYLVNGWAYLEAKCFEKGNVKANLFNNRVPINGKDFGYKDLCIKAAAGIKENKRLTVYLSYSQISDYDPLDIDHTIIEIRDINRKKVLGNKIKIPKAYIDQVVKSCRREAVQEVKEKLEEGDAFIDEQIRSEDGRSFIGRKIAEKLNDIEKASGLNKDEIVSDNECKKVLREESAKAFKKLKVKAPKSKKIELKTPSNPPIGKMEQISKIDDKKNLYIQRMDEKMAKNVSQSKGNSKSWRVRTYQPRKGTEIYIVGNAYIAIADSKPLIIKSFNPSDWKEK